MSGIEHAQDPSSLQSGPRKTFHGRALAVIRAGTQAGPIVVEIEVEGLLTRQVQVDGISGHAR